MSRSENVSVSKPKIGGAVYRAPAGSTLPTDATTALDAVFVSQGYTSEDGITNGVAIETGTVKAWGGDIVEAYQTEKKDTFKFVLIESLNPDVLKTVHGDANVTGGLTTGITVKVNTEELAESVWVFDMIMKKKTLKRIVVPVAKITEMGDVVYKDDDLIAYEITITALADKDGCYHYEYLKGATANG